MKKDSSEYKIKKSEDNRYHCGYCEASYTRGNRLRNHVLSKHDIAPDETHLRQTCTYPDCGETFHKRSQLLEHQKRQHKLMFKEKIMNFENIHEFNKWKEHEELTNHVYFSKKYGETNTMNSCHVYYFCQHDGMYESHHKKGEPMRKTNRRFNRGSVKQGNSCPARIVLNKLKDSENVSVHYISTHNHKINLENTIFQPTPYSVRSDIKAKLSIGVPVEDVYKDIREGLASRNNRDINMNNITRAHLIQKSTISSMKWKIKQRKRLHPDDGISTRLLVEKIKQAEDYNPFIVYKPQGQKVLIGPTVYDDLDVNNDLFVIGIQTKPQLEMFIKGMAPKVIQDKLYESLLVLSNERNESIF